jgi:hypothetical protein
MQTANKPEIGALSGATFISWIFYGFVGCHAVSRYWQYDQPITLEPGGGTPDIAAKAGLVVRDVCGNVVLDFRQRSFYAANRAYIVANELNRTLHRARCPNAVGAVPTVSGTTFRAWRDYAEWRSISTLRKFRSAEMVT